MRLLRIVLASSYIVAVLSFKRFCIVNCENIPWNPTSFADMFVNTMSIDESSVWNVCNVADGENLPDDISSYTGVIITGSHFDCRSSRAKYFDWFEPIISFIREAAETGRPKIYGSCFGCNLVALALGGVVATNPGSRYVLKVEDMQPLNGFQEAFSTSGFEGIAPEIPILRDKYSVICTHEDCVEILPPKSVLLGSTPLCKNHLFVTGKHENILGCQSHPEFDLQYAVMDRIWPSIVGKLKRLSDAEIQESLASFEKYTGDGASELCTLISAFLHSDQIRERQDGG
jgi:GMP synthase-like glutamine amidotransferase